MRAATAANKKEERIKRKRTLITGGIGAAQEGARTRKTLAVSPIKGNCLCNFLSVFGYQFTPRPLYRHRRGGRSVLFFLAVGYAVAGEFFLMPLDDKIVHEGQ